MSNLQPNCCLEFEFRKVDQHAGGKWLIHDTKRRKDNQLQSLKLPAEYPSWVARCDNMLELPGCFRPWTSSLNIGLDMLPSASFMSCLHVYIPH